MKTKFELIMIVLQIELCWLFIKAWRKKEESFFEKGKRIVSVEIMYKRLQSYCDKMMLLTYKYKKLCSIGSSPMEQKMRRVIAK